MNVEERLSKALGSIGFTKIKMNTEKIHLFYRPNGVNVEIVALTDTLFGDEMDAYQYDNITKQIKDTFINYGFLDVTFLGLLCTKRPDLAKHLILEEDNHWVVDLDSMRLLIYENQGNEFMDVRREVLHVLENRQYNKSGRSGWIRRRSSDHIFTFTLINTGIVIINIIIHLIVHNTTILGTTDEVIGKGALSWFLVKHANEYYRFLTSMFLHSNLSHLMNNMLVLFFVGDKFERVAGKIRYLIVYLGSGILAGLTSVVYNMINDKVSLTFSVGASGAIFGIVGAMLYVLIRNKGHVEGISSRQVLLFALISIYGGFSTKSTDNAAHIGGFIGGILLSAILYGLSKKSVRREGTS